MPEPKRRPTIEVKDRWYIIDKRSFPRVTSVLDVIHEPGLEAWREKVGKDEADRISKESSELGSRIHKECEKLALQRAHGGAVELDPELVGYTDAFATWLKEEVEEVLFVEETVWTEEHPVYAGTIDLVVKLTPKDGKWRGVSVTDLKTSKKLRTNYRMQTAAYVPALRERTGVQADIRHLLHLPSDRPGKLRFTPLTDLDDDYRAFCAAHYLHQYTWYYRQDWMRLSA